MVFKRREPLGWGAWLREMVYPRGGFRRATRYVIHRMSRLPDEPHRIARGIFAGSLIGFLPLPGLQFVAAWAAARLMRGNVLAALLGTFSGLLIGPITTIYYDTGFLIGLKGFVAAIIGGLASYPLAAAGAVLVGLLESFSSFWASAFKEVLVFTLIIPVLLWRSFNSHHVEDEE